MAINGKLLTAGTDFEELTKDCLPLLCDDADNGLLHLFYDRQATLDSLSHMLHAPRKAPARFKVKAIIIKELKCDLTALKLALEKCTETKAIFMERNELRADGMEAVMQALSTKNNLEKLAIKRNYIGDKGAEVVGRTLLASKNESLNTLYLGYCNISAKGIEQIASAILKPPLSASITALDLTANFLKVDGAVALAKMLAQHKSLKILRVGGNCIEDAGAKAIAEAAIMNTSLTELHLEGNHISDTGFRSIADTLRRGCPLVSLQLNNNEIESQGAMYLAQAMRMNTTLTRMDLSSNRVGDRGAEHIAGVIRSATQLTALRLVDNAISAEGIKYIASALQTNTTLQLLDLDVNPIGDQDPLVRAMRIRGVGVLRVCNHAYGNLVRAKPPDPKKSPEEETKEAEKKEGEGDKDEKLARRKPSLDTGNVKLKIEKKVAAPKPEGPVGNLFKKWSASGTGQGSKQAKSMDFKEFVEMLKYLCIVPQRMSRMQAQEVFRQANRAGGVGDGDNLEMDWGEFQFAIKKLAERIKVPMDEIAKGAPLPDNSPGRKKSSMTPRPTPEKPTLDPEADMDTVFGFFAAGDGQSKKRAATMDGKEFLALLDYLQLMPDKISKTYAMETYNKAKAKVSSNTSELDWDGFVWGMKRVAKQAGLAFDEMHKTHKTL